ncbi:hypothetical protein KEM55_002023 [Ascosphaera atra]|nr:hypothetical protein KEM55_002023 [Ascosphaera atra]
MARESEQELRKLTYNQLLQRVIESRVNEQRRSMTEELVEEFPPSLHEEEEAQHAMHGAMPEDDVFVGQNEKRRHQEEEEQQPPRSQQPPKKSRTGKATVRKPANLSPLPRTPAAQTRGTRGARTNPSASANPIARTIAANQSPQTPSPTEGRTRGAGLRSQKRKNYAANNPDLPQEVTVKLRDLKDPHFLKRVRLDPARTACEAIVEQTWDGDAVKTVTWAAGEKTVASGTQRAALVAQAGGEKPPMPCTYCQANGGVFDECRVNSAWPANGACASCAY